MKIGDNTKAILNDVFNQIPQVQAAKIASEATSMDQMKEMLNQSLKDAGKSALTGTQIAALALLFDLDKAGRETFVAQLVGQIIAQEAPGLIAKIFGFFGKLFGKKSG